MSIRSAVLKNFIILLTILLSAPYASLYGKSLANNDAFVEIERVKIRDNIRYAFKDSVSLAVSDDAYFLLRACVLRKADKEGKIVAERDLCDFDKNFRYVSHTFLGKDNVLFASAGTKNIHAIDTRTLEILWSRQLANYLRSSVAGNNYGELFFTTTDNKLYALEQNNGKVLWSNYISKCSLHNLPPSRPIAHGDTIFFNYSPGYISALNRTGDVLWNKQFNYIRRVYGTPTFVAQNKLFTIDDNRLTELDMKTGDNKWQADFQHVNGVAFSYDSGTIFAVDSNQTLHAINSKTTQTLWSTPLPVSKIREMAATKNTLVLFAKNNKALLFDAATGALIAAKKIRLSNYSNILTYQDNIYVYSAGNNSIYKIPPLSKRAKKEK